MRLFGYLKRKLYILLAYFRLIQKCDFKNIIVYYCRCFIVAVSSSIHF